MPVIFQPENIQKILEGKKTQTRRLGKYQLKVGRVYGIKDRWFAKATAYVRITRRFKQRLGDISTEDLQKEGYRNIWEFQAAWIRMHKHWNPDAIVTVYEFKLDEGNGRIQARLSENLRMPL